MDAQPRDTRRLASLLGCAPQGLPALDALSAEELERLCDLVEQGLARHEQAMATGVPAFLRRLLALLGGKQA
jgi:hypothetical protein